MLGQEAEDLTTLMARSGLECWIIFIRMITLILWFLSIESSVCLENEIPGWKLLFVIPDNPTIPQHLSQL